MSVSMCEIKEQQGEKAYTLAGFKHYAMICLTSPLNKLYRIPPTHCVINLNILTLHGMLQNLQNLYRLFTSFIRLHLV